MADYYFKMDDMAVGYQGKTLIHDINIGIDKGEIVTLIGPNGSGKSTILKSITKQLKLIGGKVFFDDTSLQEMSYKELSSNMAVVLTERIKTELMTCHEIVATGRYPYTGRLGILTPEDEQIVDEAMKAVHAEDLGNRDFNAISDGQKQRVLLARAICQEPEIIVLDEPTSFLDVRYKLELLAILERMARKKHITVIMSLHEIDLAQTVNHIRKLFISCDMDLRNCNIRKCYNLFLHLSVRIRMLMFHISLTMRISSNMHFRDCQIIKCEIEFRFFLLLFLVLHAIPPTVIFISR